MSKTIAHLQLPWLLKIWKDALESSSYDVSITWPFISDKDPHWLNKPINNTPTQVAGACPDQVTTLLHHGHTL